MSQRPDSAGTATRDGLGGSAACGWALQNGLPCAVPSCTWLHCIRSTRLNCAVVMGCKAERAPPPQSTPRACTSEVHSEESLEGHPGMQWPGGPRGGTHASRVGGCCDASPGVRSPGCYSSAEKLCSWPGAARVDGRALPRPCGLSGGARPLRTAKAWCCECSRAHARARTCASPHPVAEAGRARGEPRRRAPFKNARPRGCVPEQGVRA